MAFLGSLFSSILPAVSGLVKNIPIIGDVVRGVSNLVGGGDSQREQQMATPQAVRNDNPSTAQYLPNSPLAGGEDEASELRMKNNRLEGLVDSLLSKVGNSRYAPQFIQKIANNDTVKNLAKAGVSALNKKAKSRSSKYEELASMLGI